jgi:hypothetical protein
MNLQNKYVVGLMIQGYEKEMLPEYLMSCSGMLQNLNSKEQVYFEFCINVQENYESYEQDTDYIVSLIDSKIRDWMQVYSIPYENVNIFVKKTDDTFYSIADYRRDLNDKWCNRVDFVLWGETDSMWPKQTLEIVEALTSLNTCVPKFVLNFAGRKNWDATWDRITHPLFSNVKFDESDEWVLNNEASEKSYMTYERMCQINDIPLEDVQIQLFTEPKADGSCLVISSDLIRSGVNIPKSLILCGEDESFLRMAKKILGHNFVQYHVHNILRVHNRRHPKKRLGIVGENNPRGFCDERKGNWWKELEEDSKYNLETLFEQIPTIKNDLSLIDKLLLYIKEDKSENMATTSKKFKRDLFNFFKETSQDIIACEFGTHKGQTTYILSQIFKKVYTINQSEKSFESAKIVNKNRNNISYVVLDLYNDDFNKTPFMEGVVDVFFIDAGHSYDNVIHDVKRVQYLKPNRPVWVIFDDYGLIKDVKRAVDDLCETEIMNIDSYIGHEKGHEFKEGRILLDWEGVICKLY